MSAREKRIPGRDHTRRAAVRKPDPDAPSGGVSNLVANAFLIRLHCLFPLHNIQEASVSIPVIKAIIESQLYRCKLLA